jgi:hypothetical protein
MSMKIFEITPRISRIVSVLALLCLVAVTGCLEEVIDQNEVNTARLIALNVLKKPTQFNLAYTSINEKSVPKLSEGWCKDDKFNLTNTFSGKREYYFLVECKQTFVIRINMKSPITLIYVEPYIEYPKPPST